MLTLSNLSKRFGSLQALDRLSLSLDAGEIVGFVGANGAGKSTTMRIVMGVLAADSGSVTWKGSPVDASTRRAIGYMPEERGLYPRMKVTEQLVYLARLHGLSASAAKAAADQWTERLGLEERRGDEVQSLSLGNQQRVQLAAALVSDPELLILDEPFSGLDPVAVDVMSQVLLERAAAGVPTLFSSHQLDVVERLCDRVIIIRSGRLVADGTVPELQASEAPRWRIVVEPPQDAAPLEADALSALASPETQIDGQGRLIITAAGTDEQKLLRTALQNAARQGTRIILAVGKEEGTNNYLPLYPLDLIAAGNTLGHITFHSGRDGLVRGLYMEEGHLPALSWALVDRTAQSNRNETLNMLLDRRWDVREPMLPGALKELPPTLSAAALLRGDVSPEQLKGRKVLLGSTAIGSGDFFVSPLEDAQPRRISGLELHAVAAEAQIIHHFKQPLSPPLQGSIEVLVVLLTMLSAHFFDPRLMWDKAAQRNTKAT